MQNKSKEEPSGIYKSVQEYYGRVLSSNKQLQSSACSTTPSNNSLLRLANSQVHSEVQEKFYGCGSPIPEALQGCTVLDLGCGTGRDCFIASQLVGETGRVIGVDMTDEQLEVARRHNDWHMKKFGFQKSNVEFKLGYIENLTELQIEDSSVDVVISNCVINLSPNKERVFSEIFRVLKPGGELFFSDVFSLQRIPEHLRSDQVLLGECLAGALYFEDFRRLLLSFDCPDFRIVSQSPVKAHVGPVSKKIGMIDFLSVTVRAFKLDTLEDRSEDYGQIATYLGSLVEHEHSFDFDLHHRFVTNKPVPVCGNTAAMLQDTRYAKHFLVQGDRTRHFGLFEAAPVQIREAEQQSASCC